MPAPPQRATLRMGSERAVCRTTDSPKPLFEKREKGLRRVRSGALAHHTTAYCFIRILQPM